MSISFCQCVCVGTNKYIRAFRYRQNGKKREPTVVTKYDARDFKFLIEPSLFTRCSAAKSLLWSSQDEVK